VLGAENELMLLEILYGVTNSYAGVAYEQWELNE
jgi:hypothetical protein